MELDSGILKIIDEVNQTAKLIFTDYFIDGKRVLSNQKIFERSGSGEHCIKLPDNLIIPELFQPIEGKYIVFLSNEIFKCFKDYKKKEMLSIEEEEYGLVYIITSSSKVLIGKRKNVVTCDFDNYFALDDDCIKTDNYDGHVNVNDITKILNNEILIIEYQEYTIRIFKTMLPNLKGGDTLTIYFRKGTDITFQTMFEMKKESGINVYSLYTFVKY